MGRRHYVWMAMVNVVLLFFPAADHAFAQDNQTGSSLPYLNPALPIDARVDDLISRMTLEEKASQLVNQARAVPRLNIPAYDWWNEGLHGVARAGIATVFPESIGLAATWDPDLMHQIATVIGTEARAKHHEAVRQGKREIFYGLTFWSPNINIFRDPRWGRGQETFGEDPYLTSRMGVAFVTGLQGDDPKYLRVVSTPKHFAVHSGPEPSRHVFDAVVSRRDMEDTYLPAFHATVAEAKAGSVMCAYNRVNGEPACASTFLLEDKLRGEWGFQGYVVSDCDAVADIERGHHFTKTIEEAAAVSLKRGTDLECADFMRHQTSNEDYIKYVNAVHQGLLSEKDVDEALRRLFHARFRLGMFDPPEMVPYAQIPYSENDTQPHRELALKAARESIVLLKNNGALPLQPNVKKIAVVGPLADSTRVLLGNYNGTPSRATTALQGIQQQFRGAQVSFVPGTHFLHAVEPVPASLLSIGNGKAGTGLRAEYFNNKELSGEPVVKRADKDVNFEFNGSPAPGIDGQNFSVRWTGELIPQSSGTYSLGVTGDDGFRLYVNGKLLVEDWSKHSAHTLTKPVELKKGRRYPIKLEYYQDGGGATAKLVWQQGGETAAEALAAARKADVVIAVVGITSDLEGEEMNVQVEGFKGGDRTSLDLPREEEQLVEVVKSTGKPLVVVLMNGSALAVNWANQNADAILDAWYSGEEGGTAIAETLAGSNNPAGRLPVTFYKSVDQLPPFEDYAMKGRTYRYFEGEPLYPFGFGLSYSKFEYQNLKVGAAKPDGGVMVEAEVTNTGEREGDEVAELYISRKSSQYTVPRIALKSFQRVHLKPKESRQLSFQLSRDQLASIDENGRHVFEPGEFSVSVGGRQLDASAEQAHTVVAGKFTVSQ